MLSYKIRMVGPSWFQQIVSIAGGILTLAACFAMIAAIVLAFALAGSLRRARARFATMEDVAPLLTEIRALVRNLDGVMTALREDVVAVRETVAAANTGAREVVRRVRTVCDARRPRGGRAGGGRGGPGDRGRDRSRGACGGVRDTGFVVGRNPRARIRLVRRRCGTCSRSGAVPMTSGRRLWNREGGDTSDAHEWRRGRRTSEGTRPGDRDPARSAAEASRTLAAAPPARGAGRSWLEDHDLRTTHRRRHRRSRSVPAPRFSLRGNTVAEARFSYRRPMAELRAAGPEGRPLGREWASAVPSGCGRKATNAVGSRSPHEAVARPFARLSPGAHRDLQEQSAGERRELRRTLRR